MVGGWGERPVCACEHSFFFFGLRSAVSGRGREGRHTHTPADQKNHSHTTFAFCPLATTKSFHPMQRCLSTPTPALARTARRSVAAAAVPREVRVFCFFSAFPIGRTKKVSSATRGADRGASLYCVQCSMQGGQAGATPAKNWRADWCRLSSADRLGLSVLTFFPLFSSPLTRRRRPPPSWLR